MTDIRADEIDELLRLADVRAYASSEEHQRARTDIVVAARNAVPAIKAMRDAESADARQAKIVAYLHNEAARLIAGGSEARGGELNHQAYAIERGDHLKEPGK